MSGKPYTSALASINRGNLAGAGIANNDADVFAALLRAVYNLAAERRYAYLMLGLTTADPLLAVARKYLHIDYHSQLYLGSWETENDGLGQALDARVPYIEIATL